MKFTGEELLKISQGKPISRARQKELREEEIAALDAELVRRANLSGNPCTMPRKRRAT